MLRLPMPANKQHRLFDEPDEAPWEADDQRLQWVATIVAPNGPPRELDYCVPMALQGRVAPGQRLRVPLGRGDHTIVGYCVKLEYRAAGPRKLKEVAELVDEQSLLSPSMLRLTSWIAEHYICPLAQVLEAVVPAGVRGQAGTRLTTFLSVPAEIAGQLAELKLPVKQLAVLRYLAASPVGLTPQQLADGAQCGPGPITALRRKGLVASEARRVQQADRVAVAHTPEQNLILNADQQAALNTILAALQGKRHETILLRGVTGSGKTEVYIRAIQEVISYGRQAIVLVPEISLTPQAQQRFKARFGQVAVLHSHLTDAERHYQWQRIARGEAPVIVGARSAIFSPAPQLGLIVLDEEHEGSFKQDTAPRYHARDVAIERAKAESVPLVLGSATPSLESWLRAQRGEYRLVTMPTRVEDRPLPSVMTIDLRNESRDRIAGGALSRPMQLAMKEALQDKGQVILLLNRRGYSTHIQCPACGEVLRCPHCDIALTHHRQAHIVLCHYCEHEVPPPQKCPSCDFAGINYGGVGTQRLEAEVRARFPEHRCLRMDTDSMQGPGSHERALESFRSGEAHILLGTQMIAKGLDFPNVTLVGVVNADTALHLPDFRAAERTFQLLVQVAGRTGRGPRGGRVLIQSLNPDHPAIKAAVRHDYLAFAEQELPLRECLAYPPFASMARLVMRGESQVTTRAFADELAERLTAALASHEAAARVLGPAPAPIAKLRGRYRFQIQIQSPHGERLRQAVAAATQDIKPPNDVQWIVDIDPLDML